METSKNKIVCLVDISNQNTNQGLIHTFGKDYTNGNDLFHNFITNKFISDFLYLQNCGQIILGSNGNNCLLITRNACPILKSVTDICDDDKWEILLIHDSIEINQLIPLMSKNTLLMYHNTPFISGQESIKIVSIGESTIEILKGKKGHHESGNYGYKQLLQLTQAWEQQENGVYGFTPSKYEAAKQNIIDWFGLNAKLNSALEFLHQSLGSNNADKGILTHPDCFSSDELSTEEADAESKTITSIDKLINTLQGYQPTNTEYYPTLTRVRDRLLAKANVG